MILIKVKNNIKLFIKKCLKMQLNLYDIKYYKDYITCKIGTDDLNELVKKCYFSEIEVLKHYGKNGLKKHFVKYKFDYSILVFIIVSLYLISNVIVSVDIKHENKNLRNEIQKILEEKNIKPYTIALSVGKLNKISDSIVRENNDTLEWLSIYRSGMKYIVSFEERIIKNETKEDGFCNIVASKSGVIKKVITFNGENIVERDKVVNKGDILISGTIKKDEEIKKNVCASGEVLAEVWYKVNVSYPLKYKNVTKTKKKRINFRYNDNYFYKKHYKSYQEKVLLKLGSFKIIREYETKEETKKYTRDEAINNAKESIKTEILKKTSSNSQIIDQKVLKESEFDSKIELEVFVSVLENISKREYFEESDINDTN